MVVKKQEIIISIQHFNVSLFFKIYAVILLTCPLPITTKAQDRTVETINSNWTFYKGDTSNLENAAHNAVWEKV